MGVCGCVWVCVHAHVRAKVISTSCSLVERKHPVGDPHLAPNSLRRVGIASVMFLPLPNHLEGAGNPAGTSYMFDESINRYTWSWSIDHIAIHSLDDSPGSGKERTG